MKHLLPTIFTAFLLVSASACSSVFDSGQQNPSLDGVIIQVESHEEQNVRILVAYSDIDDGKVWLGLSNETEILLEEGRSFPRVGPEALEVGQEVRAWTTEVWLYSNPPQAGALRLVLDKQ